MVKTKESVPELIKIFSVVLFVGAFVLSSVGIMFFSVFDVYRGTQGLAIVDPLTGEISSYIPAISFLGLGILVLFLAVLEYFAGRDILKGKNWARWFVLVMSALGLLASIFSLKDYNFAVGIFGTLLYGFVIWYLLFCKSLKNFF